MTTRELPQVPTAHSTAAQRLIRSMPMYQNWRITRWETPVVDITQLAMVSLLDADRELCVTFEAFRRPGRPRWRVRFRECPAYRNIDEAYRTDLWSWLDESGQRCGHTFTVLESPPLASWGTVYLPRVRPAMQHYVIGTEDDVIEVLTPAVPVWEVAPAADAAEPMPGKSEHLYLGEDDEAIERLVTETRRRQEPE